MAPERMAKILVMAVAILCLVGRLPAAAQALPLEDKAKYERALEQKVDEILLRILGPNQAKVVIDATMDFTRTERLEVNSAASADKGAMFRWQNVTAEAGGGAQLMPGFPVASAMNPLAGDSQSYQRELAYPLSFVKKMSVTLILSKTVTAVEAENIRVVVGDLLGVNPKRGDELALVRAPFAPVWKTIWYTPETVSLVFRYGVLTFMGILAMIVVAVGFLKLAGAMSTMAKTQQSHQISMDLGKGGEGGLEGLQLPSGGERPSLPGPGKMPEEEVAGGGNGEVVLHVRPDQVGFLVYMMAKEDPANVALITAHLPTDIRSEFLKNLPTDMSTEVIANMAKVRFLEPEVISNIKDELERRLSGAVGGVQKVLEALEKVDLKAKKAMIARLEEKYPDVAGDVRAQVLLPEDLAGLSEKDMSVLVSAVKVEDWSAAAWDIPELLKAKLKSQMAAKTWEMMEQTMKYGSPSPEKTAAAVEMVVGTALKLIKDGRIVNPLLVPIKMLVGGARKERPEGGLPEPAAPGFEPTAAYEPGAGLKPLPEPESVVEPSSTTGQPGTDDEKA